MFFFLLHSAFFWRSSFDVRAQDIIDAATTHNKYKYYFIISTPRKKYEQQKETATLVYLVKMRQKMNKDLMYTHAHE